ncbi:hypothetical protein ACLI1X_16545, partial [Enterococcus faecalis]|uniref:hypothetical protein n=1 Tax=Enterococcus faecalis TaxID=1351 RepID=UPI00398897BF
MATVPSRDRRTRGSFTESPQQDCPTDETHAESPLPLPTPRPVAAHGHGHAPGVRPGRRVQ